MRAAPTAVPNVGKRDIPSPILFGRQGYLNVKLWYHMPHLNIDRTTRRSRDTAGAWRPHSKVNALDAFDSDDVGTELFVGVVVAAFAHQVEIEFGQQVWECVGVINFPDVTIFIAKTEAVTGRRGLVSNVLCTVGPTAKA